MQHAYLSPNMRLLNSNHALTNVIQSFIHSFMSSQANYDATQSVMQLDKTSIELDHTHLHRGVVAIPHFCG